jgi:hypothetical protein
MSTAPSTGATPTSSMHPPGAATPPKREITLISHSMLFYWWPIWVIGFTMALITYFENRHLAVLPENVTVKSSSTGYEIAVQKDHATKSVEEAARRSEGGQPVAFPTRISSKSWMGPVFCVVLLLTVVITNVQLRGLWSFLVILLLIVIALAISLVPNGWDQLLGAVGNLHIYINMAGYLFIATVVFILWAVSVFIFDQRTYLIVTPGQIQVCEHVGASIRSFDTTGLTFEKQRDDLFRHWLLGFFSGDLIVRTAGAERETIRLPNVLWIGWRLEEVQALLREKATVQNA